MYIINLNSSKTENISLMANKNTVSWLWHRKVGHVSISILNRLVKLNLVNGLPKIKFIQDKICDACAMGK